MPEQQSVSRTPFKPVLLKLLDQAWNDLQSFLRDLSADEQTAPGEPEHWAARDHLAHITFWQERLLLRLQAALRHETPPEREKTVEQLNSQVFVEHRQSAWSELFLEAERSYTSLVSHLQQLTEEDLVAFDRFRWMREGEPLCTSIVDNSYEHILAHLAQYHLDRHESQRALQFYEQWTARGVQTEAPEIIQAQLLYNQACFFATHDQLEKASISLRQALTLYPRFQELAHADPDLALLRAQQA